MYSIFGDGQPITVASRGDSCLSICFNMLLITVARCDINGVETLNMQQK